MNMPTRISALRPALSQRGLSLIELLIAIALGVLLLLGLVQIFSGVRTTFAATESLSRVQENSRFALEFLRRDVRMAGHMGCLNEFGHFPLTTPRPTEPQFVYNFVSPGAARDDVYYTLRIDVPIQVYDYNASPTGPGDTYAITSDNPTPPDAAGNWTPALPTELGITADALPGSDVIVVRYFDEALISIAPPGMIDGETGAMPLTAADAARVVTGGVYGLTNCQGAALFQVTGKSGNTIEVNAAPNVARASGKWWNDNDVPVGAGTMMFRYRAVAYYIGRGVNGPALMRKALSEGGNSAASTDDDIDFAAAEEVVSGIEMMQVLLGVDTDAVRDDTVDAYVDGTALLAGLADESAREAALRQITSVRVSLLSRGDNSRSGAQGPASYVVGETRVTPPNDGRLRQVYDSLIALRNRLRA